MPTQRPITDPTKWATSSGSARISTRRSASHSLRIGASGSQNADRNIGIGGSARNASRPRAFTEKQISARRQREQENLERWQKYHKYWSEVRARVKLFEHWDQKEQLRRVKSTGSHLNQLDALDCPLAAFGSLDQLSSPNHPTRYRSFNPSLSCSPKIQRLNWSRNQLQTDCTIAENKQLANEVVANQLRSMLINELYVFDPRKIPYDVDVALLRRPNALENLKEQVKKQENKLSRLRQECLVVKRRLKLKQGSRASLNEHRKQLEQLYLEYSRSWLPDWQQRLSRLELKCSDEELNLLFPARRGQIKGKDRLRLRNNLVSEHLNRCRQLLLQVRKLSGHHKMKSMTAQDAESRKQRHKLCDQQKDRLNGEDAHLCRKYSDPEDRRNQSEKLNFQDDNEMQSYLIQLLTDDKRQVLASVLTTTINMLDTFTSTIKRRANLYTALFDEEAKDVWKNESNDLKERIKVCIMLMAKVYKLYASVYKEEIDLLDKQIEQSNLELENRTKLFDRNLDNLKQNNVLILNLIDRSLLNLTNSSKE